MTVFQERLPNDMASLVRRIEALERNLQQAQAARRLEAATIGKGGIVIKGGAVVLQDTAGNEIGRMGVREDLLPQPDGAPQPGFILRRNDGSIAFTLDDPNPQDGTYRQILKMSDAQGNLIFQENEVDGWGLMRPTFGVPLYPLDKADLTNRPGTTDTTFWPAWLIESFPAWNPVLDVSALAVTTGGGTTGQMQLVVNGAVRGGPVSVTNVETQTSWTVDLTSLGNEPGDFISIEIQVCRTGSVVGKCVASPAWCITRGY